MENVSSPSKKKFQSPSTLFVQRIRRIFCERDKGRKKKEGRSIKEILSVAARAIGRRANANINPN